VENKCPFCHGLITGSQDVTVCPTCQTPHHKECWDENRGCTIYGCASAPPDEPKATIQPNSFAPPPPLPRSSPQIQVGPVFALYREWLRAAFGTYENWLKSVFVQTSISKLSTALAFALAVCLSLLTAAILVLVAIPVALAALTAPRSTTPAHGQK
jgi:hypothetical protein